MMKNLSSAGSSQPLTLDVVKNLMDADYHLTYVDYRNNLNDCTETIAQCLAEKSGDTLWESIDDTFCDSRWEEVERIRDELKEMCIRSGYTLEQVNVFFGGNEEAICDEIHNRDKSDYLGELIGNTRDIPVMVKLHSNYDCINSDWFESQGGYTYEEHYFGHMVDALNMNPCNVRKLLKSHGYKVCGLWPDKRSRNGQELVSEDDFMNELTNSCCGANLLIFMATISLKELWKANFKIDKVTIPQGNLCGLFSSCQGGGSLLEMKLLRDITFELDKAPYDYFNLCLDQENYYSVRSVFGSEEFFGNNLKITA